MLETDLAHERENHIETRRLNEKIVKNFTDKLFDADNIKKEL